MLLLVDEMPVSVVTMDDGGDDEAGVEQVDVDGWGGGGAEVDGCGGGGAEVEWPGEA